jgi:hypothetical protein
MTEIKLGSVGVSKESHTMLKNIVYKEGYPQSDKPFSSLVEASRFAFSLGYSKKVKIEGIKKTESISPRQFVVSDYEYLLFDEIKSSGKSLGGLISEYTEGGCRLIIEQLERNESIIGLLD